MGDGLCKYCPLEKKGVYVVAGGPFAGCEGSRCDEAYENFISQNSKSMKDFKLLPIDLFGELLQCLYDSEVNFCIEWIWDGGFDWGFGLEKSQSTNTLAKMINHTNLEEVGGLIMHEYMSKFDGLDSDGKPNKMYHFLGKNGLIKLS